MCVEKMQYFKKGHWECGSVGGGGGGVGGLQGYS